MTHDSNDLPAILVVDDQPSKVRKPMDAALNGHARVHVLHPSDVRQQDLKRSDLVLVDYVLDDWPERMKLPVAASPTTGLALATVLREVCDTFTPRTLTCIALQTGHLSRAKGRIQLPSVKARHVLARLNNLEWVFEKAQKNASPDDDLRYDQMVLLAEATRSLRRRWPIDQTQFAARTQDLLGMDETADWFERCWRDVCECQPPIHEFLGGSHGIFFLRWLLHQILPYPCFLWDAYSVAARLRLSVTDLQRLVLTNSSFGNELTSLKYTGILAGFLGDRWWRSAIEHYAWNLANRSSGGIDALRDRLFEETGEKVDLDPHDHPVVCLDENLQPSPIFSSPSEAVNVRPDHWPAFAESAWMTIGTIRENPMLRGMVDPLDEYRLPTAEG